MPRLIPDHAEIELFAERDRAGQVPREDIGRKSERRVVGEFERLARSR